MVCQNLPEGGQSVTIKFLLYVPKGRSLDHDISTPNPNLADLDISANTHTLQTSPNDSIKILEFYLILLKTWKLHVWSANKSKSKHLNAFLMIGRGQYSPKPIWEKYFPISKGEEQKITLDLLCWTLLWGKLGFIRSSCLGNREFVQVFFKSNRAKISNLISA